MLNPRVKVVRIRTLSLKVPPPTHTPDCAQTTEGKEGIFRMGALQTPP
jgi:hypothetical protein